MNASTNTRCRRMPSAVFRPVLLLAVLLVCAGCGESRLDKYTAQLKEDFDADERAEAAEKLGKLGDRDAVPALCSATRDPDDEVREAAAVALGALADPAAGADLAVLLRDPEKKVRRAGVKALGLIGDTERVNDLLPLLGDRSSDIREETAEALGRIGSPAALPVLRRLAMEDSDGDVRQTAAFAARRIEERVK